MQLLKSFLVNVKDLKPASFLTRSLYMLHFDRWLKVFKKENFLVLRKENLKNTPEVFNKIEQFLNLKDTLAIPKFIKKSLLLTKLKSENSKMRFPVVHDVIRKYYVIISVLKKSLIFLSQKFWTKMF